MSILKVDGESSCSPPHLVTSNHNGRIAFAHLLRLKSDEMKALTSILRAGSSSL
jgi:hypothetical protein